MNDKLQYPVYFCPSCFDSWYDEIDSDIKPSKNQVCDCGEIMDHVGFTDKF